MSCDYWRREYWRQFGKLLRQSRSGGNGNSNGKIPEWVKEIVKDVLEDAVEDAIESILEDDLDDMPLPESTRRTLQSMRTTSPYEYSLEVTYRRAKYSARTGAKEWTKEERGEVANKTRKLLRRIRVTGLPENANPVHGKKGLPRISSQAGYAAVYDLLVKMGCNLDSVFDSIYAVVEDNQEFTNEEQREITCLVGRIETHLYKGSNADVSSVSKDIQHIREISTDVFDRLVQVLEKLSSVQETWPEMSRIAQKVLSQVS